MNATTAADKGFNSTTVQLIQSEREKQDGQNKFQFHNGTINTEEGTKQSDITYSFNSTTVQLIHQFKFVSDLTKCVSIPQRYN